MYVEMSDTDFVWRVGHDQQSTPAGLSFMRFLVLTIVALVSTAVCKAGDLSVIPPQVAVAGKTQAEWSQAWWQWAASFDMEESPVADRTGALCASGQQGPIWFLAGTYGTQRTVRTCEVPKGKYLFFPLINYVVFPRAGSSKLTCDDAIEMAREITNDPSALIFELDGKTIPEMGKHRQRSPGCFNLAAKDSDGAQLFPSAANGYYVMLKPLSVGTHTINFGGILSDMSQAVTYTLIVR